MSRSAIVLGGGPGGCAAGIELARAGFAVTIVDRTPPTTSQAPESVNPYALAALSPLGVSEQLLRKHGEAIYATEALWGADQVSSTDYLLHSGGVGFNIERTRFNQFLISLARGSACDYVGRTTVRGVEAEREGWRVFLSSRVSGSWSVWAHVLVVATGRSSRLAFDRLDTRVVTLDRLVAICLVSPSASCTVRPSSSFLIESDRDGYCYMLSFRSGKLLFAVVTDADVLARSRVSIHEFWRDVLRRTRELKNRLGGVDVAPSRCWVKPAHSQYLSRPMGSNWVAVGDSLACHDPIYGSGVDHAIRTGVEGARALVRSARGDATALTEYAHARRSAYTSYLRERERCYSLEQRWADRLFWRRRQPSSLRRLPIAVDPHAVLRSADLCPEMEVLAPLEGLLPYAALRDLGASVPRDGLPAFEIAHRLRSLSPYTSDADLIVAVNALRSLGALSEYSI